MSLEDLGNLGEAIGSFGLLVTVVFLVLELRWSRSESRRMQKQDAWATNLSHVQFLMTQRDLPALLQRFTDYCDAGEVTPSTEMVRENFSKEEFSLINNKVFFEALQMESFFIQFDAGVWSADEWEQLCRTKRIMVTPKMIDALGIDWLLSQRLKEFYSESVEGTNTQERRKRVIQN